MHFSFVANCLSWQAVSLLFMSGMLVLGQSESAHATTTVGAIPGSHQVSPSGAFTYTIPIAVPPGIAGIEPKLSLAYNSQGGNGLLGMGWSLAGLSVIHRCPKTVVQDGVLGGVNYDANDRYCLDGQRLVAVNSTYGADGTEYRTETESYSRVISYGSQGSGPVRWKVWTKSGQIIEYGNTADSRIEAQGKTEVMLWSINKLSDTVGNYLTVSYIEDNPNGQFYPDRIDYTGNTNAGKSPQNSVRFVYETRPDITPTYHAGSLNRTTVRMKNVQMYAGATVLVRDYRLAYKAGGVPHRSQVASLTECVGNDFCLPDALFVWDATQNSELTQTYYQAPGGGPIWGSDYATTFPADVNGDGKTDLVQVVNGEYASQVLLANGDGSFTKSTAIGGATFWRASYGPVLAGDFNGDGKSDLIQIASGYNQAQVLIATGDGAFNQGFYQAPGGGPIWGSDYATTFPADVNGDGKTDLVQVVNGEYVGQVLLANGDGSFTKSTAAGGATFWRASYGPVLVGDFNGDGKSDLIQIASGYSQAQVLIATGDGAFNQGFYQAPGGGPIWGSDYATTFPADVNGDGKTDLVQVVNGEYVGQVLLANGDGSFTKSTAAGGATFWPASYAQTLSGDFNGDGRADIAQIAYNFYQGQILLSNGDGSYMQGFYQQPDSGPMWRASYAHAYSVDARGRGVFDIIQIANSYAQAETMSMDGSFLYHLVAITTGLGTTTAVTYKPLTDDSVYTKDSGAVYPYVDIQAPIYAVSSVSVSDGTGGNAVTDYTYAGAKSHQLGGGFLGFRQVTAHDPQAHIRSTTTYRQDYPYQGQPLSTQRLTDSDVLLSQSLITYTDQLIDPAKSPTWHQSFPTHSVESSYELTGGLISTVITDTQYDAWGNPTAIVVNSGGGYSKTTTNTYDNIIDANRWFLGRLRRSTVTSVAP